MPGVPVFLAIDVGTSGARACAVGVDGRPVAEVRRAYRTRVPLPGRAEQDPDDWRDKAMDAVAALPARVRRRVAGVGLTGQCPTMAAFDGRCRPVTAGLLYRDNRATAEADAIRLALGAEHVHDRTGHAPEAFHVAPKILWLRRHEPEAMERAHHILQPRDVVLHRLTGDVLTDETHANGTLLFDLLGRQWDPELIEALGIDEALLPPVVEPWSIVAPLSISVARELGLPPCIPVVAGAGDSQCAAYGAGVVTAGPVSEMSGSSSCLNSCVVEPLPDVRVTHYSHVVPGLFTTEVGLNTTGAAIAWAVRTLGFGGYGDFAAAATAGRARLLRSGRADAAPIFLPYLADGERDDPTACGVLTGLSDRHDRAAVAYAVVEGVAAAIASRIDVLRLAGSPVDEVRVAGGGARLDVMGQVKADILGVPVVHLAQDTTATGVAMLAASAAGHADAARAAIAASVGAGRRFEQSSRAVDVMAQRQRWYRSVRPSSAVHRLVET